MGGFPKWSGEKIGNINTALMILSLVITVFSFLLFVDYEWCPVLFKNNTVRRRETEPTDAIPGNVIVKFSIQDKILFILSTIILHSISK